jgi:hypothetical protein
LDISKQNHRKDYAFGEVFPLFTPDRTILPFQIIRTHRTNSVTQVLLKTIQGVTQATITSPMAATGLVVNQYTDYDIIVYPGILPMVITTPEGLYYLQLSDGVDTWYSDIFTIVRTVDNYLKITYWDTENIVFPNGTIDFSNGFKFNLYLPTQVGKPDYDFEEQVDKRDGYQFVEKQISKKVFKFNFLAPEFLLDAMRIIRMVDNIELTNRNDKYVANSFLITPKWQDGGYLAAVEAEFECDTVIKKLGKGLIPFEKGDYNDDYNNDFKIE